MTDIALVSYLNTRPFMDGFEALVHDKEVRFHLLPPADCAHALETGRCQMALLPSGAIPGLPGIHLLPDYCIGANGKVDSVFIFSQRPLAELVPCCSIRIHALPTPSRRFCSATTGAKTSTWLCPTSGPLTLSAAPSGR